MKSEGKLKTPGISKFFFLLKEKLIFQRSKSPFMLIGFRCFSRLQGEI